jgi:hypothetical protein
VFVSIPLAHTTWPTMAWLLFIDAIGASFPFPFPFPVPVPVSIIVAVVLRLCRDTVHNHSVLPTPEMPCLPPSTCANRTYTFCPTLLSVGYRLIAGIPLCPACLDNAGHQLTTYTALPRIVMQEIDKGAGPALLAQVVIDQRLGLAVDLLDGGSGGLSEGDWREVSNAPTPSRSAYLPRIAEFSSSATGIRPPTSNIGPAGEFLRS